MEKLYRLVGAAGMCFRAFGVTKSRPPKPKRIEAVTRKFHDELLIYDARKHQAHCLNKTAAAVWLECNGDATVAEILNCSFPHQDCESIYCAHSAISLE